MDNLSGVRPSLRRQIFQNSVKRVIRISLDSFECAAQFLDGLPRRLVVDLTFADTHHLRRVLARVDDLTEDRGHLIKEPDEVLPDVDPQPHPPFKVLKTGGA